MNCAQDFLIEIPVLRYSDQITKARQILRDDRFREIYIVDDAKKLLGYIDLTDGLRVTATKSNVTIEGYVKDAPEVHGTDAIEHVVREIKKFRTDSAAVIDGRRHILGGVLLADLFPVIISKHEFVGRVTDLMSRSVVVVNTTDTVQHILALIQETGFSTFPVLKKEKMVGIVSRSDILRGGRMRAALAHAVHTPVEKIMIKEVISIGPKERISTAADLLVHHDVSRLPVIEGGVIVGIVDRHDVLAGLR